MRSAATVPRPTSRASAPAIVAMRGIVKRFGALIAVDHADFDLRPGVHALLGENGAGKSTLVKILYGYEPADEGEIRFDGCAAEIRTPGDARRLGIGLVFQQPTLIPALTVTENVALFLPDLPRVLRHREIERQIREIAERYGLAVDPTRRAGTLSLPEQQRVEIVRVLLAGARILIFDEPTSTLPTQEIDALFAVFRRLRDDGYPIVVITHKLAEVFALADVVTVMRHGAVVATCPIGEVDEERLVTLMFGETPAEASFERAHGCETREPVLELQGITAFGDGRPLLDLDLKLAPNEIVGVAGIAGSGQRELAAAVVGMSRIQEGRRLLGGRDASRWSVRRIREAGVAFVPESPLGQELIWNMTLEENILLGSPDLYSRRGGLSLDRPAVRETWEHAVAALDLDLPDPGRRAGTLSGGNAQRFALARELVRDPKVLVALYPTHGLDVVTTSTVEQLLLRARDHGCAVLLVSQDLAELRALADRLLVMRDGRIVGELDPSRADALEIGRLMTGNA
jgi:ABC-type uncharacterized transport system ATPase subunit